MMDVINKAINQKLNSTDFTDIVLGTVINTNPLEVKINDRIVIGSSFIEPMSLGINDNSPSSALSFTVGEQVQLIRYSNGQRFYLLKTAEKAKDYRDFYPVGSVYRSFINIEPSKYFGLRWVYLGTTEVNGYTMHNWVRIRDNDFLLTEEEELMILENEGKVVLESESRE